MKSSSVVVQRAANVLKAAGFSVENGVADEPTSELNYSVNLESELFSSW